MAADPLSSPGNPIERIAVVNNHGEKLLGSLHETGSKEVVVLCHGFRASKDHEITQNLAGAIAREGISAVRFDFAGNGLISVWKLWREADDLHAVVLYFLGLNRVVKAILGHSKEVQQKKITLQNNYGQKLVGVLHETGSAELVVLCHGFQSSKECKSLVTIASALEKEGTSAFRFDFAGNGESEGSFQYGNYRREVEDLRVVVLHFFEAKRGNVALLYASRYHDVPVIVNISGRFNLEKGMEGRLGKDFMQKIKQHGYIDVFNRKGELFVKNRRVLTVHGASDRIVPAKDAYEFAKLIPNHKLHIIEGADHEYTSHQAELASIALQFIKEGLQHRNHDIQPRLPPRVNKSNNSRL
ncbi:hypothetical protein Sjap_011656 [Stephania japonica]|uniref:Serine aminopeptidase S33 domain-containing protein n=1 Tax=Stephania japonica TaxID=461633 RepID=A0AAP0P5R5_9MAGN